MKKFNFPMQKVLEYNGHIQNREKSILNEMRQKHQVLCNEMEDLHRNYEASKEEFNQKCEVGIRIHEIAVLKTNIKRIQVSIEEQSQKIIFLEAEIENQIKKIVEITRDKTSIEKLSEKHLESYKEMERKEEEIFINEFIVNAISSVANNSEENFS